jgi:hypothetical protein
MPAGQHVPRGDDQIVDVPVLVAASIVSPTATEPMSGRLPTMRNALTLAYRSPIALDL